MNRAQQAQSCAKAGHDKFFAEGREAIVSFSPALIDSLVAYAELNFSGQIAQEIAQDESSVDFYLNLLRAAFISLFDAGTIQEIHPSPIWVGPSSKNGVATPVSDSNIFPRRNQSLILWSLCAPKFSGTGIIFPPTK